MTDAEIAHLIAPISEDEPCGPSLVEDNANFMICEQYDSLVGESAVPIFGEAEEKSQAKQGMEWANLSKEILDYLKRSKDLKIATYFAVAQLRLNGLAGFGQGLFLCEKFVEVFWDSIHPLEEDPGETLEGRKMALEVFNDPQTIKILGSVPLIPGAGHHYSFSQVVEIQKTGGEQELNGLRSAVQKLDEESREVLRINATGVDRLLKALESTVNPHLEGGGDAKVKPLKFTDVKKQISGIIGALVGLGILSEEDAGVEDTSEALAEEGEVAVAVPAGVHSRQDVIDRLGEICRYYEKQEPGSPVPFLLRRTMKIVNMDFNEICEEFTLQSGNNLEMIFGKSQVKKSN